MSNPSKQKGTAFESLMVDFFRLSGFPEARRQALAGKNDTGDVGGIDGVVLECKNQKDMALAEWLNEAKREAEVANAEVWAVIHKRRLKAWPGHQYVTMDVVTFLNLLRSWVIHREQVKVT